MDDNKVLSKLIDKIENKYYGKYKGLVVDNNDPKNLGRLRLKIPSILGEDMVSGWAMPCLPYGGANDQGFFFIPEVGAGVWVEFEEGNLEYPIWVGTYWTKPGGANEVPKPANTQSPPTRKIIKTKKGHSIELEDKDGKESIIITEKTNNNKITMNRNGITIEDSNGNVITMDASSGGIPATPGIKVNGDQKVCLEGLIDWLMAHKHIGNLGAPCPLNPGDLSKLVVVKASPDGEILSKKVKLG